MDILVISNLELLLIKPPWIFECKCLYENVFISLDKLLEVVLLSCMMCIFFFFKWGSWIRCVCFDWLIDWLILAVLGLRFCARALSSCGKRGPLLIAMRGPPTAAASLAAEHRLQTRRLSSRGSRAQPLRGMRDPPRPGPEPVSPALAGRLSTTAPPGKPMMCIFNITRNCQIVAIPFFYSHQRCVKIPFAPYCYQYKILPVLNCSYFSGYVMVIEILICFLFMTNDGEHLFMCLLAIHVSSLAKCLFKYFVQYLLCCFPIIECKWCSYIF